MPFTFTTVTENDFALLHRWLNTPHVLKWWDREQTLEQVTKLYRWKIKSDTVFPSIVKLDGQPIGYIQSYNAPRVGNGWWTDVPEGVWGIDAFIGEPDFIERGHGSAMLTQFSNDLIGQPHVEKVIADPHPDNPRAIRAYEKAGFVNQGEITTPDGNALLMVKTESSVPSV